MPGTPGLSSDSWRRVLEGEGYQAVSFPCQAFHALGQQLVMARSDGVLRLQLAEPAPARADSAPIDVDPAPLAETAQGLRAWVRQVLREVLASSLQHDLADIQEKEPFADYGVDSITGVGVVRALNERLGIDLYITCLFDYSNLQRLGDYIVTAYPDLARHVLPACEPLPAAQPLDLGERSPAAQRQADNDDRAIAIVGISGRFPGSRDLEAFWEHLAAGDDLVTQVTRWEPQRCATGEQTGPFCDRGGFLEDIEQFDPLFFNISPLEATYMDPQQRLFLQEAWNALADAGCLGERRCQDISVYVGCEQGDYEQLFDALPPAQAFWGNAPSIVSARIAYYLDLQGPAITVDTACSSSLVAMHMACQSLLSGESRISLAGGVFVQSTPAFYQKANRAGMLSPSGACHTFDSRADGFVPGEGVGVVVLKRLADALADRDHIHGLIRGSGINQDGASNGITAPSALAQQRLHGSVYRNFAIDPDSIQVLEAHGTGTRLGDPIEFKALNAAFAVHTARKGYCAIGSVKSNMGHAATAAAMAGVFKILMGMRHRQIPPSLHFSQGNPAIDFANSPFIVNDRLTPWSSPEGQPRRAAISSFGFSGTNAHMVLEQPPARRRPASRVALVLVVLDARTHEQLRQRVGDLLNWCERHADFALVDLSFSLLVGRERQERRMGWLVADNDELLVALRGWLQGPRAPELPWAKVAEARLLALRSGTATPQDHYLEQLLAMVRGESSGQALDGSGLFAGLDCQRLSLPGYPFASERYWVTDEAPATPASEPASACLSDHPMMAKITDLPGAGIAVRLGADAYFLAQHRIANQPVLPGVAFLELLAQARERCLQASAGGRASLIHVAWQAPLQVPLETEVQLRLSPEVATRGCGRFEVLSDGGLHCLGHFALAGQQPACLDLQALSHACAVEQRSAADCYRHFTAMGIEYGANFRCMQGYGSNGDRAAPQLLVRLGRPESAERVSGWQLEPGLCDSALQAAANWLVEPWEQPSALVPFSLERFELFEEADAPEWAHILCHGARGEGIIPALDIVLADARGRVRACLQGLTMRAMSHSQAEAPQALACSLWQGAWSEVPSTLRVADASTPERLVLLAIDPARIDAPRTLQGLSWHALVDAYGPLEVLAAAATEALIRQLQLCLRQRDGQPVLVQLLVEAQGPGAVLEGLAAALASARLEHPSLRVQCLVLEPTPGDDAGMRRAIDQAAGLDDWLLCWRQGSWRPFLWRQLPASVGQVPWTNEEVYLLSGGLGGLGRILTEAICTDAPGARIVLGGRARGTVPSWVGALQAAGGKVEYLAFDVTDESATRQAVQTLLQRHGRLDGVIHNAGLTHDAYLLHKTAEQVNQVFAPKVQGVLNLDKATAMLDLRLFLINSSISASLGNVGQADYAAANRFMEGFARERDRQVAQGQRRGVSLALGWGYWQDGGMRIDELSLERLRQDWGLRPMPSTAGLQALYQALALGRGNLLVHYGDPLAAQRLLQGPDRAEPEDLQLWLCRQTAQLTGVPAEEIDPAQPFAEYGFDEVQRHVLAARLAEHLNLTGTGVSLLHCDCLQSVLEQALALPRPSQATDPMENVRPMDMHDDRQDDLLRPFIAEQLRKLLANVTRVQAEQMRDDRHFEHYGIDSLMVIQMTTELEKLFGPLSKTLFFEYTSIDELAAFFVRRHAPRLAELAAAAVIPAPAQAAAAQQPPAEPEAASAVAPAQDPIAIVGLSGRYPKAEDLQAFWRNLATGVDCVDEVPASRWNLEQVARQDCLGPGKRVSRWGGFLDDIDCFDPLFFNISPHDAEYMDPQERLFLECAYATFEDAGMAQGLRSTAQHRRIGVYVGVMYQEYQLYGAEQTLLGRPLALSGSSASIANRVSWSLGLNGPSLAVDSMCSASLSAIHLACQAIRSGDCEMALAGGVNLNLHPNKYLGLAQGNFASSNGRCTSFGAGGDGYVPAEGVGAVLLKPLNKALADGDRVHGIIRASQINHGGKANGFTVPNPNAQARVIGQALAAAGVDPRQIGYVEAHGTGTALGDPIELAGLAKAFGQLTDDVGYCALGSVKSNIGHCESAAGIAGLTKVLLQMRHGQLVPSLHSAELNPAIDFARSPFVVQRQLAPWPRRTDSQARECPRLAGLSSFGAGGSNAHLIIEEYLPVARPVEPVGTAQAYACVFSAANAQRLEALAKRYLAFFDSPAGSSLPLEQVAYTLRQGREHLGERLAFMADSMQMLKACLRAYLDGQQGEVTLHLGRRRHEDTSMASLLDAQALATLVEQWRVAGQHHKLLELWVNGAAIDWASALPGEHRQKVGLPSYPFARERYWYTGIVQGDSALPAAPSAGGPLLLSNRSNLAGLVFTCEVSASDSFVADHRVQGRAMMAGSALLELVRRAMHEACPPHRTGGVLSLGDIAWLAPVYTSAGSVTLQVRLQPQADAEGARFEVSETVGGDVKMTGQAHWLMAAGGEEAGAQTAALDTSGLSEYPVARLYERYAALGIDYGSSHRCLTVLHHGADRVVGRIEWPHGPASFATLSDMHPSILDAALQATLLLAGEEQVLQIPFALEALRIHAPCQPLMWVDVRRCERQAGYDLALRDEHGVLCVSVRRLQVRPLAAVSVPAATHQPAVPVGNLLLTPVWEALAMQACAPLPGATLVLGADDATLRSLRQSASQVLDCPVMPGASVEQWCERLQGLPAFDRVILLLPAGSSGPAGDERLIDAQQALAVQQLRLVQALQRCGHGQRALHYVVVTREACSEASPQPAHAGVHGFVGSLANEMPHWHVQALDLDGTEAFAWAHLAVQPAEAGQVSRRLYEGTWEGRRLMVHDPVDTDRSPYRRGGVYVVVGGSGGIGRVWSEAVARDHGAQVVWLGRRPADAAIEAACDTVAQQGPRPLYLSVDASDGAQLRQAREVVLRHFGRIDGLVHSAIVLDDRGLASMSEAQLYNSLQAKVDVSVRMAHVFGDLALDFVLFFSSLIAFTCNAGQANYALGCAFKDALARRWGRQGTLVRTMNWGYWGSTGVVSAPAYRQRMEKAGIGSIEPPQALQAICTLLNSPLEQMAFITTLSPDGLPDGLLSRHWTSRQLASQPVVQLEPGVHSWVAAHEHKAGALLDRYRDDQRQCSQLQYPLLLTQLQAAG
ncbi:hypothetical protein NS383_23680, partial [Pseudomonas oryzihabitans]